jgi:HK97 family phage prohead protease
MEQKQTRTFATVMAAAASGDEPTITISTGALDRQQDEVLPEGGDFAGYLKNPVVLFGHDHGALPVATTTQLDVVRGRGVQARFRWLDGDARAAAVRNAYEQGALRAASIGFLPRESESNGRGGRRFTRWELIEWSLCAVPANPEAVRTLKALDLWPADDVVLELDDDDGESVLDVTDFTPADRARLATAAATRRHLRRTGEPFAPVFDLRPEEVRQAMAETLPALIRSVVEREVRAAFARARGRVD